MLLFDRAHYPGEAQYQIFRYGNDRIHPPLIERADPIAERGAAAVPFLLARLESESDDLVLCNVEFGSTAGVGVGKAFRLMWDEFGLEIM